MKISFDAMFLCLIGIAAAIIVAEIACNRPIAITPTVLNVQGCQYIVSRNQDGFVNYTHLANCTNGIHPHNR